jgi:hypothetical protein
MTGAHHLVLKFSSGAELWLDGWDPPAAKTPQSMSMFTGQALSFHFSFVRWESRGEEMSEKMGERG